MIQKRSQLDTENSATSRAKRKASSAPRQRDLKVYEFYLKQAVKGKKNIKVLVLGATPELRDLSLKYNYETVSADISWPNIAAMQSVLKNKNHPHDIIIKCDWLKLDQILKGNYFDVILADASLNNITPQNHAPLMRIMAKLLKKQGCLITRNFSFDKFLQKQQLSFFQTAYQKEQINWVEFFLALLNYIFATDIEIRPHQLSVQKMVALLTLAIKNKEVIFNKEDIHKVNNLIIHGRSVVHTIYQEKEFQKITAKHFKCLNKESSVKNKQFHWPLIYYFQKK